MRLWHWELIPYLPNAMLLAQWRELCSIVKRIDEHGTPGHRLVDPIMDYPWWELYLYASKIINELGNRGYNLERSRPEFEKNIEKIKDKFNNKRPKTAFIFMSWHDGRYLNQCYYNLQEKYDRGIITQKEWDEIVHSSPVINNDISLPF